MNSFTIVRIYGETSTLGSLYDSDDKLFCLTVERTNSSDHPCIPEGVYKASRYFSPGNGYEVWRLENVPNRTQIEFHVANWPHELLGCIAPGQEYGVDPVSGEHGVLHSQAAFDRFMLVTKDEKEITFTIKS